MSKPISVLSSIQRQFQHIKQIAIALFHDMYRGEITLRATSLVYTTLLSFVPLLALGFSALKGFGVHNELEPLLLEFLAPLGSKAQELSTQVLGFVDNVKVGVLGFAGLTILMYTVISLLRQVEEAFNYVWHVQESRSLLNQFRDYLSVVLISPIIVFSLLGFVSSLQQTSLMQKLMELEYLAQLINRAGILLPTLLLTSTFTLMYLLIPNTKVQWRPALGGAMLAALLWQGAGWIFASFVVSSGQQTAIYSIFASLFLLVLWMYMGWLIILLGSRLAYYLQFPDAVAETIDPAPLNPQSKLILALAILVNITKRFLNGALPPTQYELSAELKSSIVDIEHLITELFVFNLVGKTNDTPTRFFLLKDPKLISIAQLRNYFWQGYKAQNNQLNAQLSLQYNDYESCTGLDNTIYNLTIDKL